MVENNKDAVSTGQGLDIVHCGPKIETLFVVIPGSGTLPPGQWKRGRTPWLQTIKPQSAPGVGIFSFQIDLVSNDESFSWRSVEEQGATFLDFLDRLIKDNDLGHCPLVLFAHSTGSIILRRALCLIHRDPHRFEDLRRKIALIALFACPHTTQKTTDAWKNIPLILKGHSKSRAKIELTQEMLEGLSEDAKIFERVVADIRILSFFETVETRRAHGNRAASLFRSGTILVPQQLAKTEAPQELMIAVNRDHNDICCIDSRSPQLQILSSEINTSTKHVLEVLDRVPEQFVRPTLFDQSTPATSRSVASLADLQIIQGLDPKDKARGGAFSEHVSLAILQTSDKRVIANMSPTRGGQNFALLTDFPTASMEPDLPYHNLPWSQNRFFASRTSILENLHKKLVENKGDSMFLLDDTDKVPDLRTFALFGPGGIGKSQIVNQFAHENKTRFDAILWIHADGPEKIAREFASNAVGLGLVSANSVDATDLSLTRNLLLDWLAHPVKSYEKDQDDRDNKASWLLIFDNVEDPDLLDNYWPTGGGGSILITSRDPVSENYLYSSSEQSGALKVPELDDGDATALLTRLVGSRRQDPADLEGAAAVARQLGGYPLALTQMAGVIARRDLSFSEFLELYRKDSAREDLFGHTGPARLLAGYEHTVASVWALENLKHSAILLDVISMLDADGIPEIVLENFAIGKTFPGYPSDDPQYQAARTELHSFSLISRDKDSKKIVVHRLLQDCARAKMTDERFNNIFCLSLHLVAAVWPYERLVDRKDEIGRWATCEKFYPHVLRLCKLSESPRFAPPLQLTKLYLQGPRLLLDAAWNSIMRARYAETPQMLDLASSMIRIILQRPANVVPDRELLKDLRTLDRLTSYYRGARTMHTNEPSVTLHHIETYKSHVIAEFGEQVLGGKDPSVGVAWNELGNAVLQNDDTGRAIDCYFKSIEALSGLENCTDVMLSMPRINLGFAFWIQGKISDADGTFAQAMKDRRAAHGVDDKTSFITGKLLLGYGNVKLAQGKFDESYELHLRSLHQYRSTAGYHHHRTADACRKMADHHIRREEFPAASKLLDQAAKIYAEAEFFISERACTKFRRGNLLKLLGRQEEGAQNLDAALLLYRKMCPSDDRTIDELTNDDFDKKIMFWSR